MTMDSDLASTEPPTEDALIALIAQQMRRRRWTLAAWAAPVTALAGAGVTHVFSGDPLRAVITGLLLLIALPLLIGRAMLDQLLRLAPWEDVQRHVGQRVADQPNAVLEAWLLAALAQGGEYMDRPIRTATQVLAASLRDALEGRRHVWLGLAVQHDTPVAYRLLTLDDGATWYATDVDPATDAVTILGRAEDLCPDLVATVTAGLHRPLRAYRQANHLRLLLWCERQACFARGLLHPDA